MIHDDQARADSVRVLPVLRSFNSPVPVRTIGQQTGIPLARAEPALLVLAEAGTATVNESGLWSAVKETPA